MNLNNITITPKGPAGTGRLPSANAQNSTTAKVEGLVSTLRPSDTPPALSPLKSFPEGDLAGSSILTSYNGRKYKISVLVSGKACKATSAAWKGLETQLKELEKVTTLAKRIFVPDAEKGNITRLSVAEQDLLQIDTTVTEHQVSKDFKDAYTAIASNKPITTKPTTPKAKKPVSPTSSTSEVEGIENYGNTCYINSLIQLISNNKSMSELCEKKLNKNDPFRLVLKAHREKHEVPKETIANLQTLFPNPQEQQDVSELFHSSSLNAIASLTLLQLDHRKKEQNLLTTEAFIESQVNTDLGFHIYHIDRVAHDQEGKTFKVKTDAIMPSIYTTDDNILMSLQGFISHIGEESDAGHYVAYILRNGQWSKISDNTVTVIKNEQIALTAAKQCTMALYAKLEDGEAPLELHSPPLTPRSVDVDEVSIDFSEDEKNIDESTD